MAAAAGHLDHRARAGSSRRTAPSPAGGSSLTSSKSILTSMISSISVIMGMRIRTFPLTRP